MTGDFLWFSCTAVSAGADGAAGGAGRSQGMGKVSPLWLSLLLPLGRTQPVSGVSVAITSLCSLLAFRLRPRSH